MWLLDLASPPKTEAALCPDSIPSTLRAFVHVFISLPRWVLFLDSELTPAQRS